MNITIDFATEQDLPHLADLLAELFALERDFTPDRAKQLRGLRLILDEPRSGRVFVLRVDGQVAGMVNARVSISTAEGGKVLMLEDVIVSGAHRGTGLGRQLVEYVMNWAREQGMTRATLFADVDNHPAQEFYGRLGFAPSNMKVLRKRLD